MLLGYDSRPAFGATAPSVWSRVLGHRSVLAASEQIADYVRVRLRIARDGSASTCPRSSPGGGIPPPPGPTSSTCRVGPMDGSALVGLDGSRAGAERATLTRRLTPSTTAPPWSPCEGQWMLG
jgi:hypothetical protein